jgi:hypothetical protein
MGKYIPVEPEKWAEMVKAMAEVTRLKAEVERLRKAGDAMAFNYEQMADGNGTYDSDLMKFVARWNAAKEGKQP